MALQHLTYEEVRKAALDYYHAKMLTAQSPDPVDAQCVNMGNGHRRCAVAAAFSIEVLIRNPEGTISGLIEKGDVTTDNAVALKMLQIAHDDWANAVRDDRTREAEVLERLFNRFLHTTEGD